MKPRIVFSPGQATASFEYAPQREEYFDDEAFERAAAQYRVEWTTEFECAATAGACGPGCPQHRGVP